MLTVTMTNDAPCRVDEQDGPDIIDVDDSSNDDDVTRSQVMVMSSPTTMIFMTVSTMTLIFVRERKPSSKSSRFDT